ncbi:MAG: SAM-dependent methyltransferase [Flavobacteriales bacterium]|nr:SAM-dependent methyltransferase [Flavobacteriales bacterium]
MKGKLFLIPNTIGGTYQSSLPVDTLRSIEHIRVFVVEEIRSARRLLKGIGFATDFEEVEFLLLNEHSATGTANSLLKKLQTGNDMGLISEAGCPAIADPGEDLIAAAHESGITIVPMVGPSSIILTLMGSGLNGESFAFTGYVPRESSDRIKRLRQLESLALQQKQTQLFMDAPYRNNQLFTDILDNLRPNTKVCVAADLGTTEELIKTKRVSEWKVAMPPSLHKRPVMFAIGE